MFDSTVHFIPTSRCVFLMFTRNSRLVAFLRVYLLIPEKRNYSALVSLEYLINFYNKAQTHVLLILHIFIKYYNASVS